MDEIKVKFEIAEILAREENTLLDRSKKLTDIFNILEKQLTIHSVVKPLSCPKCNGKSMYKSALYWNCNHCGNDWIER